MRKREIREVPGTRCLGLSAKCRDSLRDSVQNAPCQNGGFFGPGLENLARGRGDEVWLPKVRPESCRFGSHREPFLSCLIVVIRGVGVVGVTGAEAGRCIYKSVNDCYLSQNPRRGMQSTGRSKPNSVSVAPSRSTRNPDPLAHPPCLISISVTFANERLGEPPS